MKQVKIFHNPAAGEGEHSRETLIEAIENAGYSCSYSSTKKSAFEETIPESTDIIVLAGGDGTVRKLTSILLEHSLRGRRIPIGLIPSGTANNIARTLGIKGETKRLISSWDGAQSRSFDIGGILGLEKTPFFLEAMGFGVFPRLIREMNERKKKSDKPEDEMDEALRKLSDIVLDYKPRECSLQIDNEKFEGKFLMIEIMNIQSLGPNLNLAPLADPADGELEVILIPESRRSELAEYVDRRQKHGKAEPFFYPALKAKKIALEWQGQLMHVDDQLVRIEKGQKLKIEPIQGLLDFLV